MLLRNHYDVANNILCLGGEFDLPEFVDGIRELIISGVYRVPTGAGLTYESRLVHA